MAKNLLQYIPLGERPRPARAAIGSPARAGQRSTSTRSTSRHNLRQNDDLHGYYAFQKDLRQEPNAQGNTVPGFGDTRGGTVR